MIYIKKVLKFSFLFLIFVSFSNNNFVFAASKKNTPSTKSRSWYYQNNKDGTPSSVPNDVQNALEGRDAYFIGNTDEKTVYLTFDEGYENGYTSKILDILKERNIPATFFVVKPYILENKDLIKRMVSEGHIVANHTSNHKDMSKILDFEEFKSELEVPEELYFNIVGSDMPKFFRPPEGRYSESSLEYTKKLGYKTIFWSIAYVDWMPEKQPEPVSSLEILKSRTHNGAIILLHAVSKTNAEILPKYLDFLSSNGYTIKSLDNLK